MPASDATWAFPPGSREPDRAGRLQTRGLGDLLVTVADTEFVADVWPGNVEAMRRSHVPASGNNAAMTAAETTPTASNPAAHLPADRDLTEPTQIPKAASSDYDAVLFVSFGGPEGHDDVLPFLENVLRGKPVPRERMLEVAEHYYHFDGVSPINEQTRQLIDAVRADFAANGLDLPIYWGNRNWHPMLPDTLRQMRDDGIRNAIALVVSAYSSYSGCRQYREDIQRAQAEVGPDAPRVDKIRTFYNHPDFVAANADAVSEAMQGLDPGSLHIAFTAHSIPTPMAEKCAYRKQLRETGRLVAEAVGIPEDRWELVFQSRSGRPQDPWLEPDICDHVAALGERGVRELVIAPIGFLSDHMEVMYDLDHEAKDAAAEAGMTMHRAGTAGLHPRFVGMIRKLVLEREGRCEREAIGRYEANHDVCPLNCCPPPAMGRRPGGRPGSGPPAGARPGSGHSTGERQPGRPAS